MRRTRNTTVIAALVAALSMLMANFAFADTLEGDELTAVRTDAGALNLGTVCADEDAAGTLNLVIRRNGGANNSYKPGSTVAVGPIAASSSSGLTAGAASGSISIPSDWLDKPNNTLTSAVTATVTLNTSTLGTYSGSVTYRSTGTNAATPSGGLARDDVIPVTADVEDCGESNTAPSVSVAGPADGATYEFGSVPTPSCIVSDAEDTNESANPQVSPITGTLSSYGLGSQTVSCSYTDTGDLTDSDSVTYTISDSGAPTITDRGVTAGTIGSNGWYVSAVTNKFRASDSGAGFLSPLTNPFDFTKTSGTAQGSAVKINSGTVTDVAGNMATAIDSAPFKIDLGAPSVAYTSATAGGGNGPSDGWYKAQVTATFTATDTVSGFDSAGASTTTATAMSGASQEGASVTLSSPAFTDFAGNTTAAGVASQTFKVDMTPPTISGSDVNNTVWRNTPLSSSFTASDALSGLANSADASFTLQASAESANASTPTIVSRTVSDVAGNQRTRTLSALIDVTAPTVTCATSAPTYTLNQASPADVTATVWDGLSGAASVTAGAAPSVSTLGTKTVSVTGYDNAGNSTTVGCSYNVAAVHSEFKAPIDRLPVINKAKAGRAFPLKWRVTDAYGAPVLGMGSGSVAVTNASGCASSYSTDLIEVYTDGAGPLVELGDGWYQIDWKSPTTFVNTCKQLTAIVPGGGGPSAVFTFTK